MGLRTPSQLAYCKPNLKSHSDMVEVNLRPEKVSEVVCGTADSAERAENSRRVRSLLQLNLAAALALMLMLALLLTLLLMPASADQRADVTSEAAGRQAHRPVDSCSLQLVESIPIGLTFNSSSLGHQSTYQSWKQLLEMTTRSVDIASYYWTLLGADVVPDPSDKEGEDIYRLLMETGLRDGVTVRIAENGENRSINETKHLEDVGAAEVRRLNFTKIVGAGILHTKMWLVDGAHFYVGSANLDYRSLTQVKELGAMVTNCSELALDMKKIFQAYWLVGGTSEIPSTWPKELHTDINQDNPLPVKLPTETALIYLSSSPPELCPPGRTSDIDAIISIIDAAQRYVYIAVMDYYPMMIYGRFTYWPVIDNALRRAAINRRVKVRLLVSHWNHTRHDMIYGLKSLQALNGVHGHTVLEVRMFEVPPTSGQQIPFTRVNHNKYMVTDQVAYIGTSNWSGDYFVNTGGIGMVVNSTDPDAENSIRRQLLEVFLRDINSEHSKPLSDY